MTTPLVSIVLPETDSPAAPDYPSIVRVPIGQGPPEVLPIAVLSPLGGVDLRTVTGARLRVFLPDGTELPGTGWAASFTSTTATMVMLGHTWNALDVVLEGVYRLAPVLEVPGGEVGCSSVRIEGVRIP